MWRGTTQGGASGTRHKCHWLAEPYTEYITYYVDKNVGQHEHNTHHNT